MMRRLAADTVSELSRLAMQGDGGGNSEVQADEVVKGVDGCGDDDQVCQWVLDWTGNETAADVTNFFVNNVLRIVFILILGVISLWLLKRLVDRGMKRVAQSAISIKEQQAAIAGSPERRQADIEQANARVEQRTETLGKVLYALSRFGVVVIVFILVLGELGINLAPLVAGAGVVGVAIGFGAQKVVGDFLAGLFMISEDQFGVGDVVDLGEANGTVERLTLRTTVLRDIYGTVWHVPNGFIERVGNKSQHWSKALLDVGVAYGTDTDQASEVLLETARDMAHDPQWQDSFLDDPEVLGVETLAADAVTIRISVRTRPARQFDVQRELNRRFKKALDESGIEIPFPQRTVWIRPDPGAGEPVGAEAVHAGAPSGHERQDAPPQADAPPTTAAGATDDPEDGDD
jgi:small-conductance mechanosensitive channel